MLPLVSSITTTRDRLRLVVERRDRLQLAVVVDLEIVLHQIGDEPLVRIGDGRVQRHGVRA